MHRCWFQLFWDLIPFLDAIEEGNSKAYPHVSQTLELP